MNKKVLKKIKKDLRAIRNEEKENIRNERISNLLNYIEGYVEAKIEDEVSDDVYTLIPEGVSGPPTCIDLGEDEEIGTNFPNHGTDGSKNAGSEKIYYENEDKKNKSLSSFLKQIDNLISDMEPSQGGPDGVIFDNIYSNSKDVCRHNLPKSRCALCFFEKINNL